jgi:hypothetical protein
MPFCAPRGDDSASLDINHFVLATGRMPRLGDEVPPWHYRGWLKCNSPMIIPRRQAVGIITCAS